MSETVTYSRNGNLWSGMSLNDIKAGVANKTFKNEKTKNKAMEKAIFNFQKADNNQDGKLDLAEIQQYDTNEKKDTYKKIALGALGGLVAIGVGYMIFKKIKINKALTANLADTIDISVVKRGELLKKSAINGYVEIQNLRSIKVDPEEIKKIETCYDEILATLNKKGNHLSKGFKIISDERGIFRIQNAELDFDELLNYNTIKDVNCQPRNIKELKELVEDCNPFQVERRIVYKSRESLLKQIENKMIADPDKIKGKVKAILKAEDLCRYKNYHDFDFPDSIEHCVQKACDEQAKKNKNIKRKF